MLASMKAQTTRPFRLILVDNASSDGSADVAREALADAEGIEIVFEPAVISYRQLLEFFFQIHDPTTLNRQGNDRGMSYRSAIYYLGQAQKDCAIETIADVNASGIWPGRVVTEVEPVGDFWEAEPEHQDYLERFPNGYTCHFPRPDWVLSKRDAAE